MTNRAAGQADLDGDPVQTGVELPAAPFAVVRVALLVGLGYYAGCLAGFALRLPGSGISFFWPPTALLTGALLIVPVRGWRTLLAISFAAHGLAHWQDGVPNAIWPIQFFGNASQALLAAWLLRRRSNSPWNLATARDVVSFVVYAGVVAPAAASLIPACLYVSLSWAPDFLTAWRTGAVSNSVATLTIVPSLLTVWWMVATKHVGAPRRIAEFAALLLGIVGVPAAALVVHGTHPVSVPLAVYAPLPFLLWAAIRFGVNGISLALLVTTLTTISIALSGRNPLDGRTPTDVVIGVPFILLANALQMMVLAGVLEQSRRERASLREAEHRNNAILRALPDVTFLQTRAAGHSTATHEVSMYGTGRWLLMSLDDASAHDVLPPHDANTASALLAATTSRMPSVVEYSQTSGGGPRRFEARFVGVDTERVLTIVRDITDRWKAECDLRETRERYALATAAGGMGVWEYDTRTGGLFVEGPLKHSLGYGDDDLRDRLSDWQALIYAADRDDVLGRLEAAASGAAHTFESEFRMVHKNGSTRWIASKGGVTDTLNGQPTHIRGTYTDVTDRKESAYALRQANDALVRMGRLAAMAEVSASIAHELNQPLTAIGANASVGLRLADAAADPAMRELFADLLEDSRRAAQIVEQTRRMFTQSPGRTDPINLNDVVTDIVAMVTPRLRQAAVRVRVALHDRLPTVHADAIQMQQVLLNLVMNAIDAMDGVFDHPRLLMIATRHGRRHAVVSVVDSGHGLAATDGAHIFNAFFTTKPGGLGVGLSISRAILGNHSGALWAVPTRGGGATFRFKVPLSVEIPRTARRRATRPVVAQ